MEYVQITQAEEMPVLSPDEKTELLLSLHKARAQVASGEGVRLKQEEIGPWLRAGLDKARQKRRDGF
jgi:hypothetical protein